MSVSNEYLTRGEGGKLVVTPEGLEFLKNIVTDPVGQTYAFTSKANPMKVAAAMARLSRRGDDLRKIYLDEFALEDDERAEALMDRVITAYGDDSVQQLGTLAFVVEDASNLLTKRLEWGRFAAYLEQSTRYIVFDVKDDNEKYKYYTPNLPAALMLSYNQTMDIIFALYSEVVRGVMTYVQKRNPEPADPKERAAWRGATRAEACDAARPMLPASTRSTVGIVTSGQGAESLIRHLFADPLQEAREMGAVILREARKVMPAFLKRADMPDRGLAWVIYDRETRGGMREIAKQLLPYPSKDMEYEVRLIDYFPKDELELLPGMLFRDARHSLQEIRNVISLWDYEKKEKAFEAYVGSRLNRRHKPGRALEKAHYEWEIMGDYGTFRDLQRHRVVDAWEWQNLTWVYGYDVPALIAEAGYEEKFREAFSISSTFAKELMDAGYEEESQYATLMGHKLRYRFILNARTAFHFHELRTGPQGHPGYRRIVQEMHKQLTKVHPLIGAAMKFVNTDGNPELTRLESERATKLKLELLEKEQKGSAL